MEAICKLLEHYRQYMDDFTGKKYPNAFARFSQEAASYFAALDGADLKEAAAKLLDVRQAVWESQGSRMKRNRMHDGEKLVIATYFIPAAVAAGREDFAKVLVEEWTRRFPEETLGIGTYENIAEGFRKNWGSLFGFRRT